MRKPAAIKSLYNADNYKDVIAFCEAAKLPYTLIESNYTTKIVSSFCNISFIQSEMHKKAFIAKSMIVKDITATGLEPPDINKNDLSYFNFTMPERLKQGSHTIYNIDIKSAYANVLKNHSLISPRTFYYMTRLSKTQRLACIGMLAATKEIMEMVGNEVIERRKEVLPTENWFYFCVQRTNELMNACRSLITRDFLFYWVDGIFFDNERNAKAVGELLQGKGYKYSFDVCTDFKYHEDDKGRRIEYFKGEEKKKLFLPKKNSGVDEFLIKFLSFHKKNIQQ